MCEGGWGGGGGCVLGRWRLVSDIHSLLSLCVFLLHRNGSPGVKYQVIYFPLQALVRSFTDLMDIGLLPCEVLYKKIHSLFSLCVVPLQT